MLYRKTRMNTAANIEKSGILFKELLINLLRCEKIFFSAFKIGIIVNLPKCKKVTVGSAIRSFTFVNQSCSLVKTKCSVFKNINFVSFSMNSSQIELFLEFL